MNDFRDLKLWEKAHQLTLTVYQVSADFPKDEVYGLTSQLRRACVSIGANLAEGCGRGSDLDFARFLQIAMGLASETEYHLLLVHDLGFLSDERYEELNETIQEIKRMLVSLITKLRSKSYWNISEDESAYIES
jgi:four helix bundle protein